MVAIFASGNKNSYILWLLLTFAAVTYFSLQFAKGKNSRRDFFHGGKASSFFAVVGTLFVTVIGTVPFLTMVRIGFQNGHVGYIYYTAAALGLFVLAYAFSDGREKGYSSVAGELRATFGAPLRFEAFTGFLLMLIELVLAGGIIAGGVEFLSYFTTVDTMILRVFIFSLFFVYLFWGAIFRWNAPTTTRFFHQRPGRGFAAFPVLSWRGHRTVGKHSRAGGDADFLSSGSGPQAFFRFYPL